MSFTGAGDRIGRAIGLGFLQRSGDVRSGHDGRVVRQNPDAAAGASPSAGLAGRLCGVFAVILFLAVFCLPVHAQDIPDAAKQLLQGQESSLQEIGRWNLQTLFSWIQDAVGHDLRKPMQFLLQAGGYLLVASVLGLVAGKESWRRCIDTVTVLGFGTMSLASMMALTDTVVTAAQDCQNYLISFVPVFSSVAALGGQTTGSLVYSGMFFTMASFLSGLIEKILLPVMQIYFCFASCACIWGNAGIEEAAALFAKCLHWLLKLCGAVFGLVLGIQNVLAGAVDTAAIRTGKSALQGFIPVVGDAAAAALSGAAAAVQLLKGSLALAALLALAAAFLPTFLHCLLYSCAFAGAGIAASASGQKQCGRLCHLYFEGTKLCASILVLYFFMVFLSTALLVIAGNGG